MKRWASLVLSALFLFSLAASGEGDTSNAPPAESHENMTSQTPSDTNRPDQSEPVAVRNLPVRRKRRGAIS